MHKKTNTMESHQVTATTSATSEKRHNAMLTSPPKLRGYHTRVDSSGGYNLDEPPSFKLMKFAPGLKRTKVMVEDKKSARNSLIPPSTGTFSGRKSLEFKMSNQDTYLQHHSIHYQQFRFLEEDEIAEVQEIFNHFDLAGRGRVTTDQITQILQLLSHNIGKVEEKTLMY